MTFDVARAACRPPGVPQRSDVASFEDDALLEACGVDVCYAIASRRHGHAFCRTPRSTSARTSVSFTPKADTIPNIAPRLWWRAKGQMLGGTRLPPSRHKARIAEPMRGSGPSRFMSNGDKAKTKDQETLPKVGRAANCGRATVTRTKVQDCFGLSSPCRDHHSAEPDSVDPAHTRWCQAGERVFRSWFGAAATEDQADVSRLDKASCEGRGHEAPGRPMEIIQSRALQRKLGVVGLSWRSDLTPSLQPSRQASDDVVPGL